MDDRKSILKATTEIVAELGFGRTEFADVSKRAGLPEASVRALFPDKASLLHALLKQLTEPIVSAVGLAAANATDARTLMTSSLRVFDEWAAYHPDALKVWMRCALEQPSELEGHYYRSLFPSEFYETAAAIDRR